MTRIRMIIQYDGTDYVGWQTQKNGVAIQELIERELRKLTGEKTDIHGSGRTDSGVHARAQVAHFDTSSRIPPEKYAFALNVGLPRDIRVIYSDAVPGFDAETQEYGFHARYGVKRKHYRYAIWRAPHENPFCMRTALHIHSALDVPAMREAAHEFLGEHDFSSFKAKGTELESTVRTIYTSDWTEDGAMLYYDVSGSGFMYNMVRIMVGTMLDVGAHGRTAAGLRDAGSVKAALSNCDRALAGATAPARGLMLYRVEYEDFDTEEHLC